MKRPRRSGGASGAGTNRTDLSCFLMAVYLQRRQQQEEAAEPVGGRELHKRFPCLDNLEFASSMKAVFVVRSSLELKDRFSSHTVGGNGSSISDLWPRVTNLASRSTFLSTYLPGHNKAKIWQLLPGFGSVNFFLLSSCEKRQPLCRRLIDVGK
ncbi:hypothetical protein F2Q70_00022508 [Brassica cretica]|uniref:Uncharacterized protein n=1 Tax=Brassica cretica TaxID=69181 RepID=A0A8S9GKL6_BRACR|nr:hypothetical protein F2Q70_00022508 [Brassica cretica]